MNAVFSKVLDMSLTASFVILAVLAVRYFLRRSPKVISYALWAVVLFRLLCPISLTAPISLLGVIQPKVTVHEVGTSHVSYLPETIIPVMPADEGENAATVEREPAPIAPTAAEDKTEPAWNWMTAAAWVWLAGVCVMVVYSLVSYWRLRRCLTEASQIEPRIFLADGIPTPFVMGILKPAIYLPSDTPTEEKAYILAHERHHIRRGDHVIKLMAFAGLCVHWFNPLVWVAFFLANQDMEMSCDEAVIRKLGPEIRADYAQTLIRMASSRPVIAGMPLAFGEGDTKSRVKNMVKWKQPKTWVIVVSVMLCILAAVFCAVNPREEQAQGEVTIGMKLPRNISALDFGNERRKFFATEPIEDETANQQIIPDSVLGGIEVHDTGEQALSDKDTGALQEELGFGEAGPFEVIRSTTYGNMQVNQGDILRNYYQIDEKTYEVWFDMTMVDDKTRCNILESVYFAHDAQIEENMPEVTINLPEDVRIGLKLPVDIKDVEHGDEIWFCPVDYENPEALKEPWGGVRTYSAPADSWRKSSMDAWLKELGVPQILDGMHDYMASSSLDGTLEVSFVDAGGRETHHYYYTQGDTVFELWFAAVLDDMTLAAIRESLYFAPDARIQRSLPFAHSDFPADMAADAQQWEEEVYLERCRSVLESLRSKQSYSAKILRSNYGDVFLNDSSTSVYFRDGADWLLIHRIPESGFVSGVNQFGYMTVDGKHFNNDGRGMDKNEEVNWGPAQSDDSVLPWIETFDWNAQDVLYVSKIPAGRGLCFTLQVMAPYSNHPDAYPYYQMQFIFNENSEFERIENTFYFRNAQEQDYSAKETILLINDSAADAIAYEYQRYLDMQ